MSNLQKSFDSSIFAFQVNSGSDCNYSLHAFCPERFRMPSIDGKEIQSSWPVSPSLVRASRGPNMEQDLRFLGLSGTRLKGFHWKWEEAKKWSEQRVAGLALRGPLLMYTDGKCYTSAPKTRTDYQGLSGWLEWSRNKKKKAKECLWMWIYIIWTLCWQITA